MNEQLFVNGTAGDTLAAALTSGATTMTMSAGSGAKMPTLANGDYVLRTLAPAAGETASEVVKVTAVSGEVFTIVRAQEGAPQAWVIGDKCEVRNTALFMNRVKPLWRASGLLPNATPVVVALAGKDANAIYRASVNPSSGDTVTVESGTSSTGPWTAWPNGPVTAPAYGNSYPNAAAPVTHLRFTRAAGTSALSRYYVAETDNA